MKTFKQYFSEAFSTFENWDIAIANNSMLKAAVDLLNKLDDFKPGSENLIVGGAVRDMLMNKTPKDIDIVTNIPVSEIEKIFKSADIGKSKSFGIVSVTHMGYQFDVANYRTEQGYSDGRHPDQVQIAQSFEQDSARRDFTINALGIDKNGKIVDYHNGLEDLKNNLIRAVGNAKERFKEDSLRIFRLLRFSARLGFSVDPNTLEAAKELKDETNKIAMERITDELYKAANSGKSLAKYIEQLDSIGLLEKMLPEIKALEDKEQEKIHHPEGTALLHTLSALRVSRSNNPVTNLAILFHDVGKAVTYHPTDKKGNKKHTYYGHDSAGMNIIDNIGRRLKMSSEDINTLKFCAQRHMLAHNPDRLNKSTIVKIVNDPNWNVLKEVVYADEMSRPAPVGSEERVLKAIEYMENIAKEVSAGGETKGLKDRIKNLIDGNKLLAWFPELLKNKPMIGEILKKVTEWIINNNKFNVTEQDIKDFIKLNILR